MTGGEAQELLVKLSSAYPSAKLTQDTLRLYAKTLRGWNAKLGEGAVESAIAGCKFFPSLAELGSHYGIVREQRAREYRELERRREDAVYDSLPRPPLKDIPGADWQTLEAPNLPEEGQGDCSDCGKKRRLYRLGKFQVCATCARRRQRCAA